MDNNMLRDEDCPLPYIDFNKFCRYQSDMLLKETDLFFNNHNLRLKKYILPVKLPDWAKSFSDVLDTGEEYEPLTTIYRHKHFLKCRILHNYSYIETRWNRSNDPRNKNIPFDLRPLTTEILNQLDIIDEDILDPEFSGLLITLNTYPYYNEDKPSSGEAQENEKQPNNINGVEKVNGVKKNGPVCEKKQKYSKIICGALVECLITNERCIKSMWFHPNLSKHSSRLVLQNFLPRLMYEVFQLPSVIDESGKVSKFNKFTYIMHNDLDLFPRQCWLLFASIKKMSLPRHYEPSTFEDHPVSLVYGECHTDEVGYLKLRHEEENFDDNDTETNTPVSEDDDMTFNKNKLIHLDDYNIDLLNVQLNHSTLDPSTVVDNGSKSVEMVNSAVGGINDSDKSTVSERMDSSTTRNSIQETDVNPIDDVPDTSNNVDTNNNPNNNSTNNPDMNGNAPNMNKVNSSIVDNKSKRNVKSVSGMNHEVSDNTKNRLIKLLNSNVRINNLYKLFISVGSVNSTRNVSCTCRREKLKKNVDDQAWLDRLVGCSENYMYLMLAKRVERPRLGLLNRDGWRDLLITYVDNVLLHDLNKLLPDYLQTDDNLNANINYNNNTEEWCQLKREDLIDVTSDTEVYMRLPDNYNN